MWPVRHSVLSGPAGVLGDQLCAVCQSGSAAGHALQTFWPLVPLRTQLAKVYVDLRLCVPVIGAGVLNRWVLSTRCRASWLAFEYLTLCHLVSLSYEIDWMLGRASQLLRLCSHAETRQLLSCDSRT